MDPIVGSDTATATATRTKVLSPTVEQDLKARGVALRPAPGAAALAKAILGLIDSP